MEKKKVGQIIQENNERNLDLEDDLRAYSEAVMQANYKELQETAAEGSKRDGYENKDFYLVMIPLNERGLLNTPKCIIVARRTPPTPVYKQIVYKYHHMSAELEYLWTIPSQKTYWHLWHNRHKYTNSSNPEVQRLCRFVILMETGELEKWVQKEEGYKKNALIVMNYDKKDEQPVVDELIN